MVGKVCISLETCNSTNYFLRERSTAEALLNGTVAYTWNQTAGRGQRGRTWVANPGQGLAFSVLLMPPAQEASGQYLLNMVVALAAAGALEEVAGLDVQIKWPNDLIWRDRKLVGILIEAQLSGSRVAKVVVGIGINVHQTSFPAELPDAVSLHQATGGRIDGDALVPALCAHLEQRYRMLLGGQYQTIERDYKRKLYALGEVRQFEANGRHFCGTLSGVDRQGRLLVSDQGEVRAWVHGEITWV